MSPLVLGSERLAIVETSTSTALLVLMPMIKTPIQLPNAIRLRGSGVKIRYAVDTAMSSKSGIRHVV